MLLAYAFSEPSQVATRRECEQNAQSQIDTFLLASPPAGAYALAQATQLLSSALGVASPPPLGNAFLTGAVDRCLTTHVASYAALHRAVRQHWGAWGAIAGVIATVSGQPVLEQSLLAAQLGLHLNSDVREAFIGWFAHPTFLSVLRTVTSPDDAFFCQLSDAVYFLADPEIQADLVACDLQLAAEPRQGSYVSDNFESKNHEIDVTLGELLSRALGLHQHLGIPDLPQADLRRAQSFYRAGGFFWSLEDVIARAWGPNAPTSAVAGGVNMLAYALTPWMCEAIKQHPKSDLEAFEATGEIALTHSFARIVGDITASIERLRASA